MKTQRPIVHNRDHEIGGADYIRLRGFTGHFSGTVPAVAGVGTAEVPVPYDADLTVVTFKCVYAFARVQEPSATTATALSIERSDAGGAFSGVNVTTLTIAATDYEDTASPTATLTSGQLLRIAYDGALGAAGSGYTVYLLARRTG